MKESSERIEGYLGQLCEGIEALGPKESAEVVAEVRAHLAEALIDSDGDEIAVLALFGSADALAARILEERGVVVGGATLPQAPASQQALALAVDVFVWIATVLGAYLALVFGSVAIVDLLQPSPELFGALIWTLYVVSLVVAVCFGWWTLRARRNPGKHSFGMRLLGLTRIRHAHETRVVRLRQIPDTTRPSRLVPTAAVAVGLSVVLIFAWMLVRSDEVRSEGLVITAVQENAGAVRTVTNLYQRVVRGMDATATVDTYDASASAAIAALTARRKAGAVAGYAINTFELSAVPKREGLPDPGDTVEARVTVDEYGSISETIHTAWDYHLRYGAVIDADGSSGWGWRITSVTPAQSEY